MINGGFHRHLRRIYSLGIHSFSYVDPRHHSGKSLHISGLLWEHLQSYEVNIIVATGVIVVQPKDDLCCHIFQPLQCLKWSVDNNFKFFRERWHFVYQLAAVPLSLELEPRMLSLQGLRQYGELSDHPDDNLGGYGDDFVIICDEGIPSDFPPRLSNTTNA